MYFRHLHRTRIAVCIYRNNGYIVTLGEQIRCLFGQSSYVLFFPSFQGRKIFKHLLFRLHYSQALSAFGVELVDKLQTKFNHLCHGEVLRKPAILIAILAIIRAKASACLCTMIGTVKRHTATLTKLLFHSKFVYRACKLLLQAVVKCRSVELYATSLCTGARKTFMNRCGNNSPTQMRGDHHTFSCST